MRRPGVRAGTVLLGAYLVAFFVYLESPLLVILLTSFGRSASLTFPPHGFSLHWYARLWDYARDAAGLQPGLVASAWTSVWLGLTVMVGAVAAGVLVAFALHRYAFRGQNLVRQGFLLPLLFPQIVVGVGLLLWFSAIRGVPVWARLVLGHMILTLPYVVVTTGASLETLDVRLEEAAMNLGANRLQTFWYITLPSVRSGIISGALFAWLISFSNFTVTFFLYSGEMRPLPVWIYDDLQRLIDPSLAALSTLVLLLTLGVLLIMNRLLALGRLVGLRG
jgi:putative spermidine/putrescine transport system permease protein